MTAAVAFCLAYGVIILINRLILTEFLEESLLVTKGIALLIKGTAAWIEGFVFGITYRYIVRDDRNPFLKDGAVLAFALVRGLAPVEIVTHWSESFYLLIILGVEGFVCFTIARFALDSTMSKRKATNERG